MLPRLRITRTFDPSREDTAVAPSATTSFGFNTSSSAPSHQEQRCISPALGSGMQPLLAAHLIFEMLDRIGNVTAIAVHARLLKAFVQKAAGRPDEWPT